MKVKIIEVGGAFFLAASLVMNDSKHIEVRSYHGEPQPTRILGEALSTATVAAIPFFAEWDSSLRRIPL